MNFAWSDEVCCLLAKSYFDHLKCSRKCVLHMVHSTWYCTMVLVAIISFWLLIVVAASFHIPHKSLWMPCIYSKQPNVFDSVLLDLIIMWLVRLQNHCIEFDVYSLDWFNDARILFLQMWLTAVTVDVYAAQRKLVIWIFWIGNSRHSKNTTRTHTDIEQCIITCGFCLTVLNTASVLFLPLIILQC